RSCCSNYHGGDLPGIRRLVRQIVHRRPPQSRCRIEDRGSRIALFDPRSSILYPLSSITQVARLVSSFFLCYHKVFLHAYISLCASSGGAGGLTSTLAIRLLPVVDRPNGEGQGTVSIMVNRNLLREFDPQDTDFKSELDANFERDIDSYLQ